MKREFQVGDRVRVRTLRGMKMDPMVSTQNVYLRYEGCPTPFNALDMIEYCGKEGIITDLIREGVYFIDLDKGCWHWASWMLEPVEDSGEKHNLDFEILLQLAGL